MPPHPTQHANQFHERRHTYIPEHAQRIMAQRMERNLPASMKKYVGPYMQQNVMQPSLAGAGVGPQPTSQFKAPPRVMPSFGQQASFQQVPDQPAAPPAPAGPQPLPQPQTQIQPQAPNPAATPAAAAGPTPVQPYDFIMNADQKPGRSLALPLPSLNSTPKRAIFAAAGLVVLLIIFAIIKSALSGSSSLPLFIGIAQDQQSIIHIITDATTGPESTTALSTANQNFAATTTASVSSSQAAVITYLANNKLKVKPKQLNLKVSKQLDTELTNAAAAGTYDSTFQQIMKDQLNTYISDLSQVYDKSAGKKGRTLLSNDYNQAKLLQTQLNTGQ